MAKWSIKRKGKPVDMSEKLIQEILLKMKYVKNKKFNDFLFQNTSKRHFLNVIFDTYSYFIFSLEQLTSLGIVHFDFKFDNTLIDLKTELPLIIDFGLSIPIEKMMDSNG